MRLHTENGSSQSQCLRRRWRCSCLANTLFVYRYSNFKHPHCGCVYRSPLSFLHIDERNQHHTSPWRVAQIEENLRHTHMLGHISSTNHRHIQARGVHERTHPVFVWCGNCAVYMFVWASYVRSTRHTHKTLCARGSLSDVVRTLIWFISWLILYSWLVLTERNKYKQ